MVNDRNWFFDDWFQVQSKVQYILVFAPVVIIAIMYCFAYFFPERLKDWNNNEKYNDYQSAKT